MSDAPWGEIIQPDDPKPGEVWQHKGTGARYTVFLVGLGILNCGWSPTVTYQSAEGSFFTRPVGDFMDKFTKVPE